MNSAGILAALLALTCTATGVRAEDPAAETTTSPDAEAAPVSGLQLNTIAVVGSKQEILELPGAGAFVDTEEIRQYGYADVNRVLRKVPGVHVREEDGYGLFPNLSLRGVDTNRSSKVTIMEDGILTAPAPYSAPSAYYSPNAGRMAGVEILKGSSQIRFGPHTTGGVVNYRSTAIPEEATSYGRLTFGTNEEIRAHAHTGGTEQTRIGAVGYVLEGFYQANEGYKHIQETADFRDGDDTGILRYEPMLKLSWVPKGSDHQRFEAKIGYTNLDANVGYMGLTDADFEADPFQRYAASRMDRMRMHHMRGYLRHTIQLSQDFDITSTGYYANMHRDWFKLQDIRDETGRRWSMSEAIGRGGIAASAPGFDSTGLDVLKGQAAGELRVRHNNRRYELYGGETVLHGYADGGGLSHEISAGVRLHHDNVRRNQRNELFTQSATGTITDQDPGTPGDAGHRRQRTDAIAVFAQDAMAVGKFTITPGVRYEHLEQDWIDYGSANPEVRDSSLDLLAGGVGAVYDHNASWSAFGGLHWGFSPPGPRASERNDLKEETSLGAELGVRYLSSDGAGQAELAVFRTELDDLIVINNIGGAGSGDTENIGSVESHGVEFSAAWDAGVRAGWDINTPAFIAATWTDSTLDGDADSTDAESLFAGGRDGASLPYIPEITATVGVGLETETAGISAQVHYVDESFTTASNADTLIRPDGTPDARFGKTDSRTTVDLSGFIQVRENLRLVAGVHNVTDEEFVVSRHPHGARPGRGRYGFLGFETEF